MRNSKPIYVPETEGTSGAGEKRESAPADFTAVKPDRPDSGAADGFTAVKRSPARAGADALTDEQRSGLACIACGRAFVVGVASVPVALFDGGQLFVHESGCDQHV